MITLFWGVVIAHTSVWFVDTWAKSSKASFEKMDRLRGKR